MLRMTEIEPGDIEPGQPDPTPGDADKLRAGIESIESLELPDMGQLLDRIGSSKVVLLGESTHGTKEFYDLRTKITMSLIKDAGFNLVAFEADWPDMFEVNSYIHGRRENWNGFRRFPEWMWRNHSFSRLVEELRTYNASERHEAASVFGLDLYSLSSSLHEVGKYLRAKHPDLAETAFSAGDCLGPWLEDPAKYGLAVWSGTLKGCRDQVVELLAKARKATATESGPDSFSALQNARVVQNAEAYYRQLYDGEVSSWNLRDTHMFETLTEILDHYGSDAKIVIWEHNSHIGNARATQMGVSGELNIGQLCRERFGNDAYLMGFLTDHGTVAAASRWEAPMEIKQLRPARADSYEHLLHQVGVPNYFLPLRRQSKEIRELLEKPRLERAVGVLYLPQTERASHYFRASLTAQFDEVVWIDETSAVEALPPVPETESADLYPTGL